MNYRMVVRTMGTILLVVAALLLLPMAVSFYYGEGLYWAYLIPIAVIALLAVPTQIFIRKQAAFRAREGYVVVAGSWILLSLFGAVPFVLSGEIPSFVDAFFETVSGFTTTGSSILTQVESLPQSLLFWRSFTHWIGGMGVLMFMLAILPNQDSAAMHLMRAEVPGPKVGKLVSKMHVTARILYGIYFALTAIEIVCLLFAGQPLFDSVVNSFATAGTGGFSIRNASIGAYNSAAVEYIISIFMLLFGVNFTLFYFVLMRRFSQVFKNEELRGYLIIVAASVAAIALNIYHIYGDAERAFRTALFQVSSVITTTGFGTVDFNQWPTFSQCILVFLMFVGACAGSTGGGLKVSRILVLGKETLKEIRRALKPRSVIAVKMDGKALTGSVLGGISVFLVAYLITMVFSILLVSLDGFDLTTSATAVISCINNIGPGLGLVGPMGNFSEFSDFSKLLLSFDMLAGRLEIFPMLILFAPSTWKRG